MRLSPWLVAFWVTFAAHLALIAADASPWTTVTKCLLAPLLAAWVVEQDGPRLLVLALAGCFLGDLFLDLGDAWFLPGMAAFAAAHVCFVTHFARRGAFAALRNRPWIPAVLAVAALVLLAWVWGGLEPGLRIPVVVYAALLSTTAATALAVDRRAGIGGLLFLFSDAVIALGVAGRVTEGTGQALTIMVTYGLALFALSTGIVLLSRRRATDCWPSLPEAAR